MKMLFAFVDGCSTNPLPPTPFDICVPIMGLLYTVSEYVRNIVACVL